MFFFVEELPGLIDGLKEKAKKDYLDYAVRRTLREGRKYNLLFSGAAQGMLVKTIGMDSSLRKNIQCGIYTGGDKHAANVLLHLEDSDIKIDENGLGSGVVYIRTGKQEATRVRIPLPDDDGVKRLLAKSPLPIRTRSSSCNSLERYPIRSLFLTSFCLLLIFHRKRLDKIVSICYT